jgi:hypothetical protein
MFNDIFGGVYEIRQKKRRVRRGKKIALRESFFLFPCNS